MQPLIASALDIGAPIIGLPIGLSTGEPAKKGFSVRRQSFMVFVMSAIVLGVFLLIYKQASVTQLLYQQQILEKEYTELIAQQARLTQQFFRLKNPTGIQTYATKVLGLQKTVLASVRQIKQDRVAGIEGHR